MDRKVETSLFKILNVLYSIREEQGMMGWGIREQLADMLGAPPTKEEVVAFLDAYACEHRLTTTSEALAEYAGDEDAIDDIWYSTKHMEEPIAEFLSLWDASGKRVDPFGFGAGEHRVWHVTPEEYR